MSALGVGKLNQVLEDVVRAGVGGLVPLLVARVELVQFEVPEAAVRVAVELGRSVFVVDRIALEPLLKPHGAHDVVIGHRVERVERILYSFLGAESDLEVRAHAGARVPAVIEDLIVLEAPRLEDVGVGIIGLDEIILAILLVEEEDLVSGWGYFIGAAEPVLELRLLPNRIRPQLEFFIILREVLPCIFDRIPQVLKS